MQVTQQQAIPYQFFQGLNSGTEETITWPDQYEGLITDISLVVTGSSGVPIALVVDGSGVAYASATADVSGPTGFVSGSWHGFQVIPSGSVLKLATEGGDCDVAISGWLLDPPGSTIFAE